MNKEELDKTTKRCPYCGEIIKAEAKKCRYCGEWLTEKEPEDSSPTVEPEARESYQAVNTPQNLVDNSQEEHNLSSVCIKRKKKNERVLDILYCLVLVGELLGMRAIKYDHDQVSVCLEVLSMIGFCGLLMYLHRCTTALGIDMKRPILVLIISSVCGIFFSQTVESDDIAILVIFLLISIFYLYACTHIGIKLIRRPTSEFRATGWLFIAYALFGIFAFFSAFTNAQSQSLVWTGIDGILTIALAYQLKRGCSKNDNGQPFAKDNLFNGEIIVIAGGALCILLFPLFQHANRSEGSVTSRESAIEDNTIVNDSAYATDEDTEDGYNESSTVQSPYNNTSEYLDDYNGCSYSYNANGDMFDIIKNGYLLVDLKGAYNDFYIDPDKDYNIKMFGNKIIIIGTWGGIKKNVYTYDVDKEELYTVATNCVDATFEDNQLGIKDTNEWKWYDVE